MHDGMLVRVFTARDYESNHNDGCILSIEKVPAAKSFFVRPQTLLSVEKKRRGF
jgi:hypothetical protein